MKTAEAPFPFTSMFQNGPRRQASAPQNLFKPGKDFPPPRKNRAPLPAPGRSENLALEKGKGANAKPKPFSVRSLLPPPFGRHRRHPVMLTRPRNPKIRSPPLDDVNNLRHHCKCQRRFASTAIQIRRNALFTSSEYAAPFGRVLDRTQNLHAKGVPVRSSPPLTSPQTRKNCVKQDRIARNCNALT